jgi:hypothetical protein
VQKAGETVYSISYFDKTSNKSVTEEVKPNTEDQLILQATEKMRATDKLPRLTIDAPRDISFSVVRNLTARFHEEGFKAIHAKVQDKPEAGGGEGDKGKGKAKH